MNVVKIGIDSFSINGDTFSFEYLNRYLWDFVELEESVTVKTIMDILSCSPEFYALALMEPYLPDLVESYQKTKDDIKEPNEHIDVIDNVYCCQYAEIWEYEGQELKEFSIVKDFSGNSDSDEESYGLSFVPIRSLIDLPLSISEEIKLHHYSCGKTEHVLFNCGDYRFTVLELLKCIVFEITFYGSEEDKIETSKDIQKTVKEVEDAIADGKLHKFKNVDELFEELDI